ncbi:MAG: putative quinol monooxygenase [Deltaproteobacteria bacterium]|jgi:quinol monooxygenase YgiN
MIHVIASARIKAGKVPEFLEIFKANIPAVKNEKGCVAYVPAVDIDAGLPPQQMDEHVVTVLEKWESLEALHDHLKSPHMLAYREKVKGIVEDVSLKILKEA